MLHRPAPDLHISVKYLAKVMVSLRSDAKKKKKEREKKEEKKKGGGHLH